MSKRRNLLGNAKIRVTDHCVQRYLEHTENVSKNDFYDMLNKAKNGDRNAKNKINCVRYELESKFRNTGLKKLLVNNTEMRHELSGDMNHRCNFVAIKKGNSFIVKTAYLQGKKNNVWKRADQA